MRKIKAVMAVLLTLLALTPVAQAQAPAQQIRVMVGTAELSFDTAPVVEEGRTLVPLRTLAESLGFTVAYDAADRRITLTKDDRILELWVDATKARVNGKEFGLEVAPKIMGNRTMVPIRFVSEQLGATVSWNGAERLVQVRRGEEVGRELYERSQAVLMANPLADQKVSGKLLISMKMGGAGPIGGITLDMPMEVDLHTYKGDMLMNLAMVQPTAQGMQTVQTQTVLQGGTLYSKLPGTEQWVLAGEADLRSVLQESANTSLLTSVQLEQELLQAAKFSLGGMETVDGAAVARVDVDLSTADLAGLTGLFADQLAPLAQQGDEMKMEVKRFRISYWVKVDTSELDRVAMEMAINLTGSQGGVPLTIQMTIQGDITYKHVSEPIVFPDLSGAVRP